MKDRLATEIQGVEQRSIMQHEERLLAQQQHKSGFAIETSLLATDQQRSVLNVSDAIRSNSLAYTPYGHHTLDNGLLSLLGFNGERLDPVTRRYLLGNGYRAYNPKLMRFNSPDSWSPFGKGGLNAYAYCDGCPVNRQDPTGHSWATIKLKLNTISKMNKPTPPNNATHVPRSGPMKNIHRIGEGAVSFEDIYKGNRRLNFFAHGNKPSPGQSSKIGVNGELWDAARLYSEAQAQGIDFKQFDSVRILACYSGNGGVNSFAANINKLTNKPTKGYIGTVQSWQNTFDPREQIDAYYEKFKKNANQFYNEDYPDIKLSIFKHNPYIPKTQARAYFKHNFLSVRFPQ
ncbi:RHS repeat-associated core domain-containing protein [Pseudomonas sp. GW101-3H06]|uniref:RHS repeat-associated core domain-containing protein n=1 Tax=Pseudomonas TaxID=286 RepID=UPI0038579A8C